MTKRRIDQSQLDWLWETYGDKSIAGNPDDVGGDGFLTKDGVAQLIAEQTQRLLASLELGNETDAGKLPVYVIRANGRRDKVFELDPEDHLVSIVRRESTQVDIDNGYAAHIGKPFVDFVMLSGRKYGLSLEDTVLTGSKTKTIEVLVQSGYIYSELIIAPNNDTAITCTDSQNGLYVTLRLSQRKGQVELLKNENGLVVEFKWADGSDVQVREMDWAKYAIDEGNRKGVIYFVKDKKFMVLNGVRYGEIPDTVLRLTILDEETGQSALVLPEKSALMQESGDELVNLVKLNDAGSLVIGQTTVRVNVFGSTEHLSYNGKALSTTDELAAEKKRVDNMVNQLNQNVASSIETINTFVTNSVNTINGAINDEIRPDIANLKTVTNDLNTALTTYKQTTDRAIETLNNTIITVNNNVNDGFTHLKQAWENAVNTINGAIDNELRPAIKALQETDVTINNNLVSAINTINEAITNAVNTINGAIDNELRPAISELKEGKVDWVDVSTNENPGRKAIVLKNHDLLLGTDTKGVTYTIGMINKWDVVDLGTSKLPINLNTPAGVRPTVQEAGQTGEEANKIAYLSDLEGIEVNFENVVKYDDVATEERPGRKAITLKNDDLILGTTTLGGTVNIAMINKWNVVDLGSNKLPINLNTPAGVRPTVQEAGQSGEEANKLAYLSDIDDINTMLGNYLTREEFDNLVKDAPEALDTLKEIADKLADNDDVAAALTTQISDLSEKVDEEVSRSTIEDEEAKARLQTLETGLSELKEKAVLYDDVATEENPGRKAIILENHDTIVGKGTDGASYNLVMLSKWNKADFGSASVEINLNGSAERPTYNDDEEIALMKDIDAIKLPIEFSFPLRTLQDKVYSQEEIFGWFGTTNAAELKTLIVREGQFYLRYGIQLSGNPYYYKMPIQYIAFESANQLKMVVIGLDTRNDMPVKYEIVINLDGTVIEGNSNIKVTSSNLAFASDIPSLDTYATKDKVAADLQSEAEARTSKDTELEESLNKKVEWTDVTTEDNPGRKSVVLANHDTILGRTTNGTTVNIAMVSKWDKVDMGSTQLPFNMNGSEERPTYNDDKSLALKDDVDAMYSKADMFGDIDPAIFAGGYTMQILSKLEQSYIDDLGTPANVDGKPYDASSNPYLLGQPYLVVGSIENVFSYDLYGLNTYNMGMVGQIAKIMKVSLDGYDIKMSNIEKRLSALEQQGN